MAKKKSRSKKSRWSLNSLIGMALTTLFGGILYPSWPAISSSVSSMLFSKVAERVPDGIPSRDDLAGGFEAVRDAVTSAISDPSNQSGVRPAGNGQVPAQQSSFQRPADRIYIASYNIQVFGTSKMAKPDVMDVIVRTIRNFDLVAIQEVRSKDDTILPQLKTMLNADGSQYDFVIGPRLGRSSSKEQYVFVYDTRRIEIDPQSVGTIVDQQDQLHREPMIARFRARTQSPQHAFTFWMVNTHTDPDEVPEEVAALGTVFRVMQSARPDEDDVILLGDLNANEHQLGPLGQIPGIHPVVTGTTTNARRTKSYDNILFDRFKTSEYTGSWGVVDIEAAFGLTSEKSLKVSDHFPVWAEFSIWEGGRTASAQPVMR